MYSYCGTYGTVGTYLRYGTVGTVGTCYDMGHVSLYNRLWSSGFSTLPPLAVKEQGIYIPKLGLGPR